MIKTIWKGDYTGDMDMPSGTRTLYYVSVEGELLKNITAEKAYTDTYGYWYDVNDIFTIRYTGFISQTLIVRINGVPTIYGGTANALTLTAGSEGYVTVSYLPAEQSDRLNVSMSILPNTRLVIRPVPFNVEHVNSLVSAIHNLQRYSSIPPTRFNISDTELSGLSFSLTPVSQVLLTLFADMDNALSIMYAKYSMGSYIDVMESYTTMSAELIQDFRKKINDLEEVLP